MNLRALALAMLAPASLAFVHDFGGFDKGRMAATTTIEIESGKPLSISCNSPHWNSGVFDWVKSGQSKERFKPHAWYNKVALAKVPADMQLGGQAIAAGDWTIHAKVPADDTSKFVLEWKQGDKSIDVPLAMKGGNDVEDHLLLALTPRGAAGSKEFELKVFYGDMKATVAGSFGAAKAQ